MKRINPRVCALLVVLAVAFVLRVTGVDFGLPLLDHPDEPALVSRADIMAKTNDFNPHFFHYPSFCFYLFMVIFKFEYFLESLELISLSRSTLYFSARIFVAVLGTLMVLVVYLIARKLYGSRVAILSSAFLAVMPMAVRDSHFATVDIPMTFFATVAFLFIVYFMEHGDLKYGLTAGVFVGLSASTKYNGGLLLLPLFLASIFYYIFYNPDFQNRRLLSFGIPNSFIYSSVIAGSSFIATSPFIALDPKTFLRDLFAEMHHMATGHGVSFLDTPPGWIYHVTNSLRSGMDYYLEITSLIGVMLIVIIVIYYFVIKNVENNRKDITAGFLLLSWILPYYLIIGSWEVKFDRYVIPLLPFLATTASYIVVRAAGLLRGFLSRLLPKSKFDYSTALCFLVATMLVIGPLQSSIRLNTNFMKDTTNQVALDWIEENIPEGSYIIRESYTPETELLAQFKTENYHYLLAAVSMSEIAKADCVIISSKMYGRFYAHPEHSKEEISFYNSLSENLTLVKVFSSNETLVGAEIKIYRVPPSFAPFQGKDEEQIR